MHVHSLPERRCAEEDGVRRQAELFEQRGFWRVSLLEHGEIDQAEEAVVDFVHLRVAGEEDEGAAAGDFEQAANDVGGLGGELRRARVGQVGRDVEDGLALVVEVRGRR